MEPASSSIENGGRVTSNGAVIGNRILFLPSSGTNSVTVRGAGSQWINNGAITVGNEGTAAMTISDGAPHHQHRWIHCRRF